MAESRPHGMLVAPSTRIPSLCFPTPLLAWLPSIWTRNSVFTRLVASFSPSDRCPAKESISSIKMIAGLESEAIWNRDRTSFSDSPTYFEIRSEELIEKNVASHSEINKRLVFYLSHKPWPRTTSPFREDRTAKYLSKACACLETFRGTLSAELLPPATFFLRSQDPQRRSIWRLAFLSRWLGSNLVSKPLPPYCPFDFRRFMGFCFELPVIYSQFGAHPHL